MSQINFQPGKPRRWLTSAEKRKAQAVIAKAARDVVADYLGGRSADACMTELVRAARGGRKMSVAASAYDRVENEKYYTPAWVTEALFSVERFSKVWDAAAGDGGIIDALPFGIECRGSDIAPDAHHIVERDFFDILDGERFDLVFNPPYGKQSALAVRFIEHALALTRPYGGKVAMLLKVGFDSADGRRHLFETHPAFVAEYRLTKRIRWTNFEQKAAGPTENHSWFVWDWSKRPGPAIKGYLPLKERADDALVGGRP